VNRLAAAAALVAAAALLPFAPIASANPAVGAKFGKIEIRAINVSMPLFEGTPDMCEGSNSKTLDIGVSHYPCSAFPWEIGTVFIAGHRTTHAAPFRRLNKLRKGYEIRVRTRRGIFIYSVRRKEIVRPRTSFNPEVPGRLLLSTCYPAGSDAYRLVVFAKLVKAPKGV
jgi:sortase A